MSRLKSGDEATHANTCRLQCSHYSDRKQSPAIRMHDYIRPGHSLSGCPFAISAITRGLVVISPIFCIAWSFVWSSHRALFLASFAFGCCGSSQSSISYHHFDLNDSDSRVYDTLSVYLPPSKKLRELRP